MCVCVRVCPGFPAPAVKLPESQTRLVIPAVNILGGNNRLLLSAHSPETCLLHCLCVCVCVCVRSLMSARVHAPQAATWWQGSKWKQVGLRFSFQQTMLCDGTPCECFCPLLCFCVLEREREFEMGRCGLALSKTGGLEDKLRPR